MTSLISPAHLAQVHRFKQLYSRFQRSRDLIAVGAYAAGTDALLDQAIAMQSSLEKFMQQDLAERASYPESLNKLNQLFASTA
jgi:flagellum-specific ATP synthase